MHPKLDSGHGTVTLKKGKVFKSTPLPSLGLVASLTASGFCFLKAGLCLKEAPSPCEGFSARTGSQQAEPRGLVEVSKSLLLTDRLFLRVMKYEKQIPWWGFLSVVQSATCMNCPRWELQNPWPFLRSVLLLFKVCWWTVQPSMLFKVLSSLCLTVFSIFPFFF